MKTHALGEPSLYFLCDCVFWEAHQHDIDVEAEKVEKLDCRDPKPPLVGRSKDMIDLSRKSDDLLGPTHRIK